MHNPKVISFFAGAKIAMLSFLLLTVSTLSAADIYLTGGDAGEPNSFENGTHFDGNPPSAGNTYIVNKGFYTNLRTREVPAGTLTPTNVVFGGDKLVLGDDSAAGKILSKSINYWTNSAHFVFHDGLIQPAQGGSGTTEAVGLGTTGTFGGDALVESPAAKPFRFAGSYSRGVRLALALSGAESTGLMVCRNFTSGDTEKKAGHFSVFLDGDNSQYLGRWTVDGFGVTDDYGTGVAPNDPKWRVKLVLADETKLGGNPTERQSDGLKLRHAGTVELAASATDRTLDFGNRTVMLVQGGGRFEHSGAGTVTLKGVFSGTDDLTLQTTGPVVFAGEWAGSGNLVVSNQVIHVSPEAQFTGTGKIVTQGTGRIVYDIDGLLELTEWPAELEGPMPIARSDIFTDPTNGPNRIAVVTIPTSAKVVTPADFVAVNAGGLGGDATLAQITFEVETNDDEIQIVYMKRPSYIWMTMAWESSESSNPQYMSDTVSQSPSKAASTAWSDGRAVHEGGDYLVYAAHAVRMADRQIETFKGNSLTLVGMASQRAELALKGKTNEVSKIFAGNYSDISFKNYSGNTRQVLTGYIYASGKNIGNENGVRIRGSSTATGDLPYPDSSVRVSEIASSISGDGDIRLSPYDAHAIHVVLSGDNSSFTGSFSVFPYGANTTTLVVSDGKNLGGNPAAFNANGLRIIDGARLYAAGDVTLDQVNRGLYLQKRACFDVPETSSLSLEMPVTYYRGTTEPGETTVVKTGAGQLKMSGDTLGGAPDTRYLITAGVFEQENATAFERLKTLAFYPGTTLLVPYQTENANGLLMKGIPTNTEYPLVLANGAEKLNVRIDVPEGTELLRHFTVPIATVPKTAADSTMSVAGEAAPVAVTSAAQIVVASPAKSYLTTVVAEDVQIDNVAYTRFVADCRLPGFMLIIR